MDNRHIALMFTKVTGMTAAELHPFAPAPFFTRAQALARGESDRSLRAALKARDLVRLRHGAYALASDLEGLNDGERHLLLARAALHQQRGVAALAGPSASLLHGFDVYGHDLAVVHLMRLDDSAGRREAGVVHHTANDAVRSRVQLVDGTLVASPEDAVWQTALLSGLEGGVVTADSALHLRPDLIGALRRLAEEEKAQPRSRTARLALRLARPEAESPGESLTRIACFRHGIPRPELQHEVVGADGFPLGRTDFYWEHARLLGEFDGKIKYGKLLREGETPTDVVVREKEREDAMRSTKKGMTRFTWHQVQPDVARRRMARLAYELEESQRLYVRVPV